jgi:hypothetical protein
MHTTGGIKVLTITKLPTELIQGIQAKALQNENTFNAIGTKLL